MSHIRFFYGNTDRKYARETELEIAVQFAVDETEFGIGGMFIALVDLWQPVTELSPANHMNRGQCSLARSIAHC